MAKRKSEADSLIAQSQAQDRIVHADYSVRLERSLATRSSNGGTRNGSVIEFWGGRASSPWRIHLDIEES